MRILLSALCLFGLTIPRIHADEPAKPEKPRYEKRREHDPNGIGKFYMGREIAMVMGHEAAGWLERPEREQEEEPAKLLPLLNLKPGDVVADIGAGSGFYSFSFRLWWARKAKSTPTTFSPRCSTSSASGRNNSK